jgi:hypothetical protein
LVIRRRVESNISHWLPLLVAYALLCPISEMEGLLE